MAILIHRKNTSNTGDLNCCPGQYFDFLKNFPIIDITKISSLEENDDIILGGGGLMSEWGDKYIISMMNKIKGKIIGWGLGKNYGKITVYPSYINKFTLLGVRDEGQSVNYIPCVSCMNSLFDLKINITKQIVALRHFDFNFHSKIDKNWPVLCNNQPMEKIIKFIGSAEIVLTNCFHGAYWSLLMGKKVLAESSTIRLLTLKDKIKFLDNTNNKIDEKLINDLLKNDELKSYNNFKDESRKLNSIFAEKVKEILSL